MHPVKEVYNGDPDIPDVAEQRTSRMPLFIAFNVPNELIKQSNL